MARSLEYWKEKLHESKEKVWKLEGSIRMSHFRYEKNGNFIKKYSSVSYKKLEPHKQACIKPVFRRGKLTSKYYLSTRFVGEKTYVWKTFFFRKKWMYDRQYKYWLQYSTRMAAKRAEIKKLKRKIEYCNEQIARLEKKD